MLELLFLILGVAVGYNIRRERQAHLENLVLEKVDARLRQELAVANNLNQSLLNDLAQLKQSARHSASAMPVSAHRVTAHELAQSLGG